MAVRKIVTIGAPVLREKAKRVREFNAKLHQLLDDMRETMMDANGVGLAAPQVGIGERIIVVRLPDDEESIEEYGDQAGVWYEVINPEIVKQARDTVEGVEACLSIPGYFGSVDRPVNTVIKGHDRDGQEIKIKAYDWLARGFLHEIDHLNGVLYIDHAKEIWEARKDEDESEEGQSEGSVAS
ncbi:MAG: peptide deformylase [Chloroflexi bacterium]|nr:peptide deformylase [Chloroflexota bacterium]